MRTKSFILLLLLLCPLAWSQTGEDLCREQRRVSEALCESDFEILVGPTCGAILIACGCALTGVTTIVCAVPCLASHLICLGVISVAHDRKDLCYRRTIVEFEQCMTQRAELCI